MTQPYRKKAVNNEQKPQGKKTAKLQQKQQSESTKANSQTRAATQYVIGKKYLGVASCEAEQHVVEGAVAAEQLLCATAIGHGVWLGAHLRKTT